MASPKAGDPVSAEDPNAIPWPGPTPPIVESPKEVIGNGQKIREEVRIAQGNRIPVCYGDMKVGYDVVYLQPSAEKYQQDGEDSYWFTAIGVVSEGPIEEFVGYVDNTTNKAYSMSQVGTYNDNGVLKFYPVWDIWGATSGIPDHNLTVSPTAAGSGEWGYTIAYCYWGYEMPFGAAIEVTTNGHATVPSNTITWAPPLDKDGYPLCKGVVVYRTSSPNPGSYPTGPIGYIEYNHTQNPGTYSLLDDALPLLDIPPAGPPATPPTAVATGPSNSRAFAVIQWIRASSTYTKFPRFLVKGKLMVDTASPITGGFTSGSSTVTVTSTTGLTAGMRFYSEYAPVGSWVTEIIDSTSLTISKQATATGSKEFYVNSTYSKNPALEMLDLKLDDVYGDGTHISLIDLDSVDSCRDYCAETVTYTDENGNTVGRDNHSCSLQLREEASNEQWHKTIGLHGNLRWQFKAGKWTMVAWKDYSVAKTLTEDDLVESPTLRRSSFAGLSDLPNRVTVEWTDRTSNGNWRVRAESVQTADVDTGSEVREGSPYQLHGIQNQHEANQAAYTILNTITADMTISMKVMPEHDDLSVGDVVAVTWGPLGLSSTTFAITGKDKNPDDTINLYGREYRVELWEQQSIKLCALASYVAYEEFSDDFVDVSYVDYIDTSQEVSGFTRTTIHKYYRGFSYKLPQPITAYKAVVVRYWYGSHGSPGHDWGEDPYTMEIVDPNVAGMSNEEDAWSSPIASDKYVRLGIGGAWKTITITETLGSDGATTIYTSTQYSESARTVRWKLVSANNEVSTADGAVFHVELNSVITTSDGPPPVPPVPYVALSTHPTYDYAPSIYWPKPNATHIDQANVYQWGVVGTGATLVGPGHATFSLANLATSLIYFDFGDPVSLSGVMGLYKDITWENSAGIVFHADSDPTSFASYTSASGLGGNKHSSSFYDDYSSSVFEHAGGPNRSYSSIGDTGAHRYWAVQPSECDEVWGVQFIPRDTEATPSDIWGYRVYRGELVSTPVNGDYYGFDYDTSPAELLASIPYSDAPTQDAPLDIRPWIMTDVVGTETAGLPYRGSSHWCALCVVAVDADGNESAEWAGIIPQWSWTSSQPAIYVDWFGSPQAVQDVSVPVYVKTGSMALAGRMASLDAFEAPTVRLNENPVNGTDYVDLLAPAALAGPYEIIYPEDAPTDGSVMTTGADGVSVWSNINGLQTLHGVPLNSSGGYDFTLSYSSVTRKATLTPTGASFNVWIKGVSHVFAGTQVSDAHTDTTGSHYLYVNAAGALTWATSFWDLRAVSPICFVHWNSTLAEGIAFDERHTAWRDPEWHLRTHEVDGTQVVSGFAISGWTPNTDSTSGVTMAVASGVVADEDIRVTTTALADGGPYTILYRTGASGEWRWDKTPVIPMLKSGDWIASNEVVTGSWSQVALGHNEWVCYWIFALPALSSTFQVILVQGQTQHATLAAAQAESVASLSWGTLPFAEIAPIAKLIFKAENGWTAANGKAVLIQVDSIRGTRTSITTSLSPGSHGALSGRSDADSHPASAITFTPYGSVSSITVQGAIEELEDEIDAIVGPGGGGISLAKAFFIGGF